MSAAMSYNSKNQRKLSILGEWFREKNIHISGHSEEALKMWIMWITNDQADFRRFLQHLRPP